MRVEYLYDITEKVTIDDCKDLVGVITAVMAEGTKLSPSYRVSWIHNGSAQHAWIEEWRLTRWVE